MTKNHKREHRLEWDICKLPHHCSYLTLGPEQGKDKTVPVKDVAWLFENQGLRGCIIVSTSKTIPEKGTEEDKSNQPPHRQASRPCAARCKQPPHALAARKPLAIHVRARGKDR